MERGGSRRRCVTRRFFTRWLSRRDQEDGASIDESCGGRQGVTGVARGLRAPFGAPRKVVRQVVRRCAAASRRRGRCSLTSCASCALRTLRSFLLHGREKRVEGRKGTPIRESRSTNRDRYDYANQFGVPPSNEATSSRKLRGTFSTSKIKLFRLEKILGVAKIQNLKTHFCPPPSGAA